MNVIWFDLIVIFYIACYYIGLYKILNMIVLNLKNKLYYCGKYE